MREPTERGAVAVEFALLLPILLLLVLAIMELGRAYNAQITLTAAAREGVRVMAITNNPNDAKIAARDAAASIDAIPLSNITISPATCTSPSPSPSTSPSPSPSPSSSSTLVTLTIPYTLSTVTGVAGPFTLTGKGVMLCGG